MSAKGVYGLREDKQEIQRQLGCMNGIFQLFDRRYLLGQRRHGQNQKRLPSGQSDDAEKVDNASEKTKEENPKKVVKEKHRVSVESSRNSFSSSCSSTTFSSLDCSKRVQTEQSSEPSSPILHRKQPDLSKQPPYIKDVVKDSMTRKPRVVSVKTVAKEERVGPTMTHVDSPRPFQHQKSAEYERKDRNLAKLCEISWGVREVKETSRFSCDGRESPYTLKSNVKVKELPRLSLDSKRGSVRNPLNEPRRSLQIRESQGGGQSQNLDQTHEPGSNKRPSSSVVARLMGLEILTDSIDKDETLKIKPSLDDKLVSTPRKGEEFKHKHVSVSPRVRKELASPQRIPLEPAPWKQESGIRGSQKPTFKNKEAAERAEHASASVYGEIEKRLTELEFETSGKDLRALKQILEAMQKTRRRLENKEKSVQPVSPSIKGTSSPKKHTAKTPAKLSSDSMVNTGLQKVKVNPADGRTDLVGRRWGRDLSPSNRRATGRTQRSLSPSHVPEYLTGQNSASSGNSGTVSPRLERSKNGVDKQSIHGSSTDLSRIRKQPNRKPIVSNSKTRNSKTKSINQLQNNEQSRGYSSGTRNSSQQGDAVSFQSESKTSLATQNEPEITSTHWTQEISSVYQPKENHKTSFAERLIEHKPMPELATLTMEQPSPVSVLDAFYTEDTPSPVKKKSSAFNDDEDLHSDEAEWNQVGIDNLVNIKEPDQCSSEFNYIKLENIKHLVRQIELLNSANDEASSTIDHTASSPCESENGDDRYITEILSASGFLEDLDRATAIVHLHPTGSLINPELFHVLEKTKGRTELTDNEYHEKNTYSKPKEKIRRKMVFDTVNDILVQKLATSGSFGLWTGKRKGRILNGENLLKELCSEIHNLQTTSARGLYDELINIISADVNKKSEDWDEYCNEGPGLALVIERLIFKDLISEVVSSEVADLQDRPGRHCRQLFPV